MTYKKPKKFDIWPKAGVEEPACFKLLAEIWKNINNI